MSHRTAVFLQVGCQIIGNIALGPRYLTLYSGVLHQGTRISDSADLILYALLCVSFVLLLWHLLAYWQHVPLPPFTMLGNAHCYYSQQEAPSVSVTSQSIHFILCAVVISLAGSALIFPGSDSIDWGMQTQKSPPFVSGLGPVWVSWAVMPLVSCACVAILMLCFRGILRTEDSFHEVVWVSRSVCKQDCKALYMLWNFKACGAHATVTSYPYNISVTFIVDAFSRLFSRSNNMLICYICTQRM